jgi:hypothetical protein
LRSKLQELGVDVDSLLEGISHDVEHDADAPESDLT